MTVIVPGRDVAEFAPEALDSLRAQTFEHWHAVLVDDGSVDDTGRVFADAAATDPRFTLVRHDRPRGLGAARNAGLDRVDSPFVAFLDADDRFTPTALHRLVSTLDASGSDFVVGAYVRLRPTGSGYAAGTVQPWVAASTSPERIGTSLAAHPEASGNIVAWSKASRVEFWRRNGLRFPENLLYEDQLVAQRMYTAARVFDVIPDVVVEWRERADGSSITQHRGDLPVLVDYLAALRGGLAVLDAAGARAAAAARVRLILAMDVPPLVGLGAKHPDPEYRRQVGSLVRELQARAAHEAPAEAAPDGVLLDGVLLDGALLAAAALW